MLDQTQTIAIIGLGYVGLPLAVAFSKHRRVIGFDIDPARIAELKSGHDRSREVLADELAAASKLELTHDVAALKQANIYIVTVPTPIDAHKRPDLGPLLRASQTVGSVLKKGDIVIYESTVYPGATEEDCVPVLETTSGLKFNADFHCGYSPERINPGDPSRRLADIVKVTAGSTPATAETVDALYQTILRAGTHRAPSIRVAEAAKVIENTQRDLNIALMNELAIIFRRLGISTVDVLKAAETKWNFLPFRPGLVGGHCIGVDPYYLTHKAQAVGYQPEVVLAGRRINDSMAEFVANELVREMILRGDMVREARILILGATFKEDCPDMRNSKVVDLVKAFAGYGMTVEVHDPEADADDLSAVFAGRVVEAPEPGRYDAVVLAVAHRSFKALGAEWIQSRGRSGAVVCDIKAALPPGCADLVL